MPPERFVKIELTAQAKTDLAALIRSGRKAEAFSALLRAFGRRGARAAGAISRDMLSGQRLARRTGSLARAITSAPELIEGLPGVRVGIFSGPALQYAGVQEFGTKGKNPESPYDTIRPVKAKALAMPVGEALTPAGVPRYASPREYPRELSFVPFRSGGKAVGALYEKRDIAKERRAASREKRGFTLQNLEAAYVLLKEVDVSPHEFLNDGMKNALPALGEDVADEVARLMRSAG